MNIWENTALPYMLDVTISLAAMGIFSDELLDFLSEKIKVFDIGIEGDSIHVSYNLITLNQAVTVMYKNYSKPFVNENLLSTALNKKYCSDRSMSEDYKSFTEDISKTLLEFVLPEKNCLLTDKFTKLGHRISWVVAVNRRNEFFEFESNNERFIEDISIPKDYRLKLLFSMGNKNYTRKVFLLKSSARIRLDTLNAMGYINLPIRQDFWTNMSHSDKIKHLEKFIYDKNRSNR